ncbi:MAG: nucleoside hydrolase [Clostridia bacterium]|nr:nucleoside hydrolase [Clostridia bacterium]
MKFDKNIYRDNLSVQKVIIDTDPGVDDEACLLYAFFEENIDIKLLTSVVGNTTLEKTTRNLLHLMDICGIDVPVAKGKEKAMERESINAEFIHQKEGLGGYVPPNETKVKLLELDGVEAMRKVIMEGDGDIVPIILGPQTNIGHLLKEHPEVIKKIPKIVFMGGSPFGHPNYPDHISFNISSDPEAFKIVLDSKIPLVMIPSDVGRRKAHLNEEFVNGLAKINKAGEILAQSYSKYWEPGYPDKRVATNDTLALFALVYPKMFTFARVSVTVDLVETPGKTLVDFDGVGNVLMVTDLDREAFLQLLLEDIKNIKVKEN